MSENVLESCGGLSAMVGALGAQRPFALPGDTPHYARDRVVDVRHIKLEIDIDPEAKRIAGTAHHTFAPINDGLTHLEFDAVEMEISGVRLEGGEQLPFSLDGGRLRIDLGGPRNAGQELTVAVSYSAQPRRGLYFVGPDEGYPDKPIQVWSQGQDEDSRHWFPCFDFPNEMATSEVVVTVPAPLTAVSNGELVSVEERDGRRTFHWRQSTPHVAYLLSVAAADFAEIVDQADGVPLQYYLPKGREEDGRRALDRTPEMVRFFSERTGIPYPYAKYAQVVVNDFIFGGMENVSATTLTDSILHDERAHVDVVDGADGLVAHELAHQWYGDLLTCRDWAHGWLNEGFATYFDALFVEHHRGVDAFRYELRENAEIYLREDAQRYRRPIVSHTYNEPIDLFDRQFYEKGSLVLHMLRVNLGDELFWKAIRHYTAKHRGTNVTTPDLQRAIEEATGRNMDAFFEQWVYSAGHPNLTVSYEWDDSAKQAKLTVRQTQSTEHSTPEVFRTAVEVDFGFENGNQSFRVELSEREQSFYCPLPEKPKMVRFDPGGGLLKTVEFKRGQDLLIYQLQHDDDVLGRIDAAKDVAKLGTKEAVDALKQAVLSDGFWAVQAEAARALGSLGTEAALDALLECLSVEHPKARRAVAGALGEFRDEPPAHRGARAAEALDGVLREGDASYFVEAEVAFALGKTHSSRAFEALEGALDKESHNQIIRVRAFDGFGELRDERAVPIAIEWTRYGRPPQARNAATACLGKLGHYVEQKDAIRDRLVELLDDPDLRTRLAAVVALRELGDDKAVPALERLAQRDLDGRVIRYAREAAARLREGRDKGEDVRKLREELDKLREDQRTLKDRMEKLETGQRMENG
ncbi:MAG: M1 family aminopeptidase [Dehalococcoidia bacterium]